jgi:hypothetical protein
MSADEICWEDAVDALNRGCVSGTTASFEADSGLICGTFLIRN